MPYKNEYGTDLGYDEIAHILKQPWVPEALKKAAEDAKSQDLYFMDPYSIITTKEVEEAWDRYQSMTKPFRRRADWIMLERIGLTNQQLYDYMYNQSLGHVTQLPMTDGNVGTSEDPIYNMRENYLQYIPPNNEVPDMENLIANIEDFELKRQEAEEYMRQTGYIILIPGVYADLDSLEHAYYTVISPEGCASILWRDASKAAEAADALKITAPDLMKFDIIDGEIKEPVGGAHTNYEEVSANMKKVILDSLHELLKLSPVDLKTKRYQKFRKMGAFLEG